jgi:hypothetical protein
MNEIGVKYIIRIASVIERIKPSYDSICRRMSKQVDF